MQTAVSDATAVAADRLARCYAGERCDWDRFYRPRQEMRNFASRYHLVYPGLAYFVTLRDDPGAAARLRPQLDTMYRGLLEPRCWTYWHDELDERTWPLQERNLTYAGRLATFIGFYIDAFGEPPAAEIALDGRRTTYSELSRSLWEQMLASPSCGVSCYHHQSMLMCNAHMLINNRLHDRLFGTDFAAANAGWLAVVEDNLLRDGNASPLFYFGTEPNRPTPLAEKHALMADHGQPDRARDMLEQAPEAIKDKPELAAVRTKLELAEKVAAIGDPSALEARLDANPDDHEARFDLAQILNARDEREAAADQLLTIMRADREWREDGARTELLKFFEAWGQSDPATVRARRKLSALLFS